MYSNSIYYSSEFDVIETTGINLLPCRQLTADRLGSIVVNHNGYVDIHAFIEF